MTRYAVGWRQANGIGRQKPFNEWQNRVKSMNARLNQLEREKADRERADAEEAEWIGQQMLKDLPF
jgi:hypothetical protein